MLDLAFWRGSVLQICRLEQAVWDAVISLSALYERPPISDSPPASLIESPAAVQHNYHREALVWYSRSLAALRQRIHRGVVDVTVSAISCILFIAIELLQGNQKAALILYKQGEQIMANTMPATSLGSLFESHSGSLMAATRLIFRRLGTWVLVNDGVSYGFWVPNSTVPEERFATISEARNILYGLVAEWKVLNKDVKMHWKAQSEGHISKISALATQQKHLEDRLRA